MTTEASIIRGLENVVVASTALSAIDGTAGRLSYAGYDIHDLAERATFEEVFYLLWYGELPNAAQLLAFGERLSAERSLSAAELALARNAPRGGHGMDALRAVSGDGATVPGPTEAGNHDRLHLMLTDEELLPAIAERVLASGARLYALTPQRITLEQLFLEVVGTEDSGQ